MKRSLLHWLFISMLLLAACSSEPTPTKTASPPPPELTPTEAAYPPVHTEQAAGNIQSTQYPPPLDTPTPPSGETPYPPPGGNTNTPPPGGETPYPPPGGTDAPTATRRAGTPSPGPTTYPGPQDTLPPAPTALVTARFEITSTQTISGTPTERPISTAMPPPRGIPETISIWHSWSPDEIQILDFVLQQFQDFYPEIAFDLLYVPQEELLSRYEIAAYRGEGPDLLFGPAEWGPSLYEQGLVADLSQDADPKFLAEINAAALGGARYRGALTGLPHSVRGGVLLFRNRALLPESPATWEELVSMAKGATRGGRVGAFLERGFLFSAGHLYGLGGRLMDESGNPAFNTPQGAAWLDLLASFDQAGAAEINTDRDLDLFKDGRIGLIIEGSWNLDDLAEAIGEENLAIDPWPTVEGGRLSGFVQANNIFLNANLRGSERYSALLFIGFMLAREVQTILTRAGHMPAVLDVEVEDPFMRQMMSVFEGGVPYPSDPALALYWDPLEAAMRAVFEEGIDPQTALRTAEAEIMEKLQGRK